MILTFQKTKLVSIFLVAASFCVVPAWADETVAIQGNAAAGAKKITTCVACHGTDGNSPISANPNLAGQHEQYLLDVLREYKNGERSNPIMAGMVANLSEQDMADLAAYFASQKENIGETDPALLQRGQQLYRAGDKNKDIPACIGCHGPTGEGNGPALFPKIAGQNPDYIMAALKSYQQEGVRDNVMMQDIASKMSDSDMLAVSSYIYGLYPAGVELPKDKTTDTKAPTDK